MKTKGGGDKEPINSHGGFRPGSGRKPADYPARMLKLRATDDEWRDFCRMIERNSRRNFVTILKALKQDPR